MRTLIRLFFAVFLISGFVPRLQAATLTLSTNQAVYAPGDTLMLSGGIVPSNDANVPSDIYVAVVLPDGSILTLTPNLTWGATLTPILKAFPLANIQAPNFYSLPLPASLPVGAYTFYLVATPTNTNPLDSSLWLGSITTSINFNTTPTCTLPQVLQNNVCVTPIPTCTLPQVLQNDVCVTPAPTCTLPQVLQNGGCVTPTPTCTPPQVLQNGVCVTPTPTCTLPQVLQNGVCVTPTSGSTPVNQTISFGTAPAAIAVGGVATVSATATSGLAVSFASTTSGVCTVSGTTVTGVTAGTCTIAATQAGNTSYNAATSVSQSIAIIVPVIINLNPTQASSTSNVVVTGTGFTPTAMVKLGTQSITPQVVSNTQLSFVVPFSLDQNSALVALQAGQYTVQVDGSNTVNLTVVALPTNPNPAGQLLASQISSTFQAISVNAPAFQAILPQWLSDQQGNPSAQTFIQDLANLVTLANTPSVQTALTQLASQIDPQSLATLEQSLLANQNASASANAALAKPVIKQNTPQIGASNQVQPLATSTSCNTLTNGDDWLACRNNLTNSVGDNLLNEAKGLNSSGNVMKYIKYACNVTGFVTEGAANIACKVIKDISDVIGEVSNMASATAESQITNNAGTLKEFTLNVAGVDSTIDTVVQPSTFNLIDPTELDITLYLNNYDNNQNLSIQTANAKYITGATLNIATTTLDWTKISAILSQNNSAATNVSTGYPVLDSFFSLYSELASVVIANNVANTPNLNLPISNTNISSVSGEIAKFMPDLYVTCSNQYDMNSLNSANIPASLTMQQNAKLQWLVLDLGPNVFPGKFSQTSSGCSYRISDAYRLPSEDAIDSYVKFFIERYPVITINVIGTGNVTYSPVPLSGHTACTSATSPCSEYFNSYAPTSPNYPNVVFTANNSDGTPATGVTWSGIGAEGCTGATATCRVTPDPTNTTEPAITATLTSSCSIGSRGPAGGIILYISSFTPCHGMEAAPTDQANATWGCWADDPSTSTGFIWTTVGSTSTAIGTGAANTAAIIAACGSMSGGDRYSGIPLGPNAAAVASAYSLNGYTDWYLPSRDELTTMSNWVGVDGYGFASNSYWSSSEVPVPPFYSAWYFLPSNYYGPEQAANYKQDTRSVRAVRSF